MTVIVTDNAIRLEGRCLVEDAEHLLVAIQDNPDLAVDVASAERLHMAVAQILWALKPRLQGMVGDPFLARYILGRSYES
ncbi:hypothetical protein [Novosphingobium sp.]|uniref:hypothetical protein n=1 Tax=Novosphingobium sp. TaxID=1874826 RepID=UPI003D0A0D17